MKRIFNVLGALLLVIFLIATSLVIMNISGSRAVNYELSITDPSGDAESGLGPNTFADDADILKITSKKISDNIIVTMQVTGIIYTNSSMNYTGYQFNFDINADNDEDWILTTSSYQFNFQNSDTLLVDDDGNFENMHYMNSTGDGTDTLTVEFPLSYISSYETIQSWNMFATSSVSSSQIFDASIDSAPDDQKFPKDENDNDNDGIPNYWEAENNLDPNNASDADDDSDEDGYTNKQEYDAETDPWSPYSKPGAAKLTLTIINPKENEEIPPGGISDYYRINGTAAAKTGDPIDHIEYRIVEAMNNQWQWCNDDSDFYDYSSWSAERETATFSGTSAYWVKGKNTIEVKAIAQSGENITESVIVYFNADAPKGDTDEDSIPDDYEDDNEMDKNDPTDALDDNDKDGYTNLAEYEEGTDPNDKNDYPGAGEDDNDGDNIPDDSDDDDDNDGMPDTWENMNGLDPMDPSDADGDIDSDGYTNLQEYNEDTDPMDSSSYPGSGNVEDNDPANAKPTDLGIQVKIKTASFKFQDLGNNISIEMLVKGTTNGVDHCELAFVGYYKNNTFDNPEWLVPFDWEDFAYEKSLLEQEGFTASYFKATSEGWRTWELKISGELQKSSESSEEYIDLNNETADMTKLMVYVRAYKDSGNTQWNQAEYRISGIGSSGKSKEEGKGFLPGFEVVALLSALGIAILLFRREK